MMLNQNSKLKWNQIENTLNRDQILNIIFDFSSVLLCVQASQDKHFSSNKKIHF